MSKIARIIDSIWLGRADYDVIELAEHNIEQVIIVAKEIDNKLPVNYYYELIDKALIKSISFSYAKPDEFGMELNVLETQTCQVYSHKFLIEDDKEIDEGMLYNIFTLIHDIIKINKRVLIHCQGGMSRSPAIIIGYLMYMGMSYSEALAFVQWRLGEKWPIFPASKTMDSIRKYFKEI